MKPSNYLERYKKLQMELSNRNAELDMIEWEMYAPSGIDYSKDRIDSSPSNDLMLSLVLRKQMRAEELSSRINYIELTLRDMEEEVNAVPEAKHKRLLHLRYIEWNKFTTWEQVAEQMRKEGFHYETDSFKGKIHSKALREFWAIKNAKK